MSIRRIGNRWQVRLRMGRGRPRYQKTLPPSAKYADARALETQVRRASIDAAVGRRHQHLIDDALDRWVETSARGLKSWTRATRYLVDVLREYTAGKPLEALPEVADKVKAAGQRAKLSAATINRHLAILRRVGNLAERWGWTDLPLGRRVQLLSEHSARHVYLTPDQVAALAAHADPVVGDMIRFLAQTGLRKGELLRLRPANIRDGVLALDANTKSGRPRGIPLPPAARRIAQARIGEDGWGISEWQLRTRFEAAREAAGVKARIHDLRHTYASWLVQAAQPLTAVRDLLGHSSLAVTNRYSHLAPSHLRAAVKSLPRIGGAKAGQKSGSRARKKAA